MRVLDRKIKASGQEAMAVTRRLRGYLLSLNRGARIGYSGYLVMIMLEVVMGNLGKLVSVTEVRGQH